MKNNIQFLLFVFISLLLSACGGGGGGDETPAGSVPSSTSTLTVSVSDSVTSSLLSSATVTINGKSKSTDNEGSVQFSLAAGQHTVAVSKSDYDSVQRQISINGENQNLTIPLSKTETPGPVDTSDKRYLFHSEFEPSYEFEHKGSPWDSQATAIWNPAGSQYAKSIRVSSGYYWGPYAVAAWGNEDANAIDTRGFDLLRFKYKSDFATQVEVSIQGVNTPESKVAYSLGTSTSLGNGWHEMEVPFPGFADLTWVGLMFPGDGTIEIADLLIVDVPVETDVTAYGAGNVANTFNPNGYRCTVDHGFWVSNAGVVEPGVPSCDNIGTPKKRYPQVVPEIAHEPIATHKWWGSVSFLGEMRIGDPNNAGYITPDPITARISERGARIMGIPNALQGQGNLFQYVVPDPFNEVFDGIAIANSKHNDMQGYLKDHSDGAMTVEWRSGSTPVMEATFVHGSPYAYFKSYDGDFQIKTTSTDGFQKGTFYQTAQALGVWTDVAGNRNSFLIVGEGNTEFSNIGGSLITVSNSSKEITVALLPSSGTPSGAMSSYFEGFARQVVRDVDISYSVNRENNEVTVAHTYLDANGASIETIAGLQPLHWKNSHEPTTQYSVRSTRGTTKFSQTNAFTYTLPFVGVLPSLPNVADLDMNTLRSLVMEYMNGGQSAWNPYTDTYWSGKSYGKAAEVIAIARSIGMNNEANTLTGWLKAELEDWFTANTSGDLDTVKYFVYDQTWTTLLGVEESFGAHQQLNDHHFHYGYFVRAAAEICRTDKSWCSESQYGPMVDLLIRDYAASKGDDMFPYLRNFDPANGFSWASGSANFVLGNNNESTSEAANAYGAIVLYGLIVGDEELVNKGIYLHSSSAATYWEYWNNLDGYRNRSPSYPNRGDSYDNFPDNYNQITTSIIWGQGASFSTWFSGAYAHILGIQGLPLNPLVFHVGLHADYMADYVELGLTESRNQKPSGLVDGQWRDIWWNLWAMTDADASIADYETLGSNYIPEEGESKVHTFHWIYNWQQLGHLETGTGELTADYPAAVAFKKGNTMSYLVYNYESEVKTIRFSDGTTLMVEPNSFGTLVK
ncbi:PEGA domain-containing protein [Enterovibrio sp. ZSDZ35]|uniref:glucan endo-1,3-beta-D-glucosidase n=1 Tax=Enterovibrio qingdaonensis TaxID=2899818 RepID=A0ABT5QFL2_9GAMM|nr:glycosyl hydrolase [Enterovibrio sp. ZSDZ35]MDD1779771.1 PEGA domain-containing protein [Enterovibrio sp. ZSDZ35]